MNKERLLQRGTEAKFRLTIDDVVMREVDFQVELIYGYRRTRVLITKEQMMTDDEGRYYFTFDSDDMHGLVAARCTYQRPDGDYTDGKRQMTDEQPLVFVVDVPNPQFACCPRWDSDDRMVHYEMVNESDVFTYYYRLCYFNGQPVITADDCYVLVLKKAADAATQETDNDNN